MTNEMVAPDSEKQNLSIIFPLLNPKDLDSTSLKFILAQLNVWSTIKEINSNKTTTFIKAKNHSYSTDT